jgi:hypothetical protein
MATRVFPDPSGTAFEPPLSPCLDPAVEDEGSADVVGDDDPWAVTPPVSVSLLEEAAMTALPPPSPLPPVLLKLGLGLGAAAADVSAGPDPSLVHHVSPVKSMQTPYTEPHFAPYSQYHSSSLLLQ